VDGLFIPFILFILSNAGREPRARSREPLYPFAAPTASAYPTPRPSSS
jgi:hypothetical protein